MGIVKTDFHKTVPPEIIDLAYRSDYNSLKEFFELNLSSPKWERLTLKATPKVEYKVLKTEYHSGTVDLKSIVKQEEFLDSSLKLEIYVSGHYTNTFALKVYKEDTSEKEKFKEKKESYLRAKRFVTEARIILLKIKREQELEKLEATLKELG